MELSKDIIRQIKKNKGKAIGAGPKGNLEFVLLKEGIEKVREIERELEKLGYPLKFEAIRRFDWYPEAYNLFLLEIIKKILNWQDSEIREMGRFEARISLITKIMMKYFISPQRVLKEVGRYWRNYHTSGKLTVEEFDPKRKYGILTLKDFLGSPTLCRYLEGYFWQIASYILPRKNLKVREIECPFQGGKVHCFQIVW